MKKKSHWALLVLVIVLMGFSLLKNKLSIAKAKPDISPSVQYFFSVNLPDAQGNVESLAQWKGKIIIANFWATWCSPCREEMPELSNIHNKYLQSGVVVLGIATDDVDKIKKYAEGKSISYPLLAGEMEAMNLSARLGNNKGIVPFTVIIDSKGKIFRTYFGRINSLYIDMDVAELLKTQPE